MARPRNKLLLALGLSASACRSAADDPRVAVAELEDRRIVAPERWEGPLARDGEEVRRRAARAVGHMRNPTLAPVVRRALHVEPDDDVKVEQLFALGQLADPESLDVLLKELGSLGSGGPAVRAAAAEAIGKLAIPRAAPNLVAHLVDPAPEVRGAALLALARLVGRRSGHKPGLADDSWPAVFLQAAPSLLADPDESVRWKAAYALAEIEIEGRVALLAQAARSPLELVRFFAAGGLARLATESPERTEALTILLRDANVFVAAAAVRARPSPAELAVIATNARRSSGPADLHVRAAASTAAALAEDDPSLLVRAAAMRARVRSGSAEEIAAVIWNARNSLDYHEVVAAIRALSSAPTSSVAIVATPLVELTSESNPFIASEALIALKVLVDASSSPSTPIAPQLRDRLLEVARRASTHGDYAVAASAVDLLKSVGSAGDLVYVDATFTRMTGFDPAEARATAVHAAASLAGKGSSDLLRRARADLSPAVVAAANEEWKKLGLPEDPRPLRPTERRPGSDEDEGETPSSIELEPGVDFLSSKPNPRVALKFRKGEVVIELLREEAPRHVKMMLTRVLAGRCDGLPIHRVVSGFVVQGLDPRGDGWGTGGVFLRDEINREPYLRGTVGMPNAGPDSGGCQVFVMLMPAPHLDGRYTVFGRVVSGMSVVDALDLGDECLDAEVMR